jgi:hypothetical protein
MSMNKLALIPIGLLIGLASCQSNEYELGELQTPTNLSVEYTIVGQDAEHPAGDGSGLVEFSASASDAISYYFDFGDGKDREVAPGGNTTHQFSKNGTITYPVTCYAVGTGGLTTSKTTLVEVFSSFTDAEAVEFLTGAGTKSWYWAANVPGHLGLGPNTYDPANPAVHTWAYWYQAAAWEKQTTCLYDGEFVFTLSGDQVQFEHLNPSGQAFIQGLYASDLGLGSEGCYAFDIAGVKNVSFAPASSSATLDGNYRGTSMQFSDGGFIGFYAGTSEYEIIEISESILKVRVVQTNQPTFAWYHTFTSTKPIQ